MKQEEKEQGKEGKEKEHKGKDRDKEIGGGCRI